MSNVSQARWVLKLVMANYKWKIVSYVKKKREKKLTMAQDASDVSQAFVDEW